MIKIELKKNDNTVERVIVSGHANYEDYGKDIVCASVSSIVITTINAMLSIDDKSIIYEQKDGFIDLKVVKDNHIIKILLNNMIKLLKELEEKYPKNIKVK